MGKKLANTYIPYWVFYCMGMVLHISYVLLTLVLGGLCIIRGHSGQAF